jgi:hypothetical protein
MHVSVQRLLKGSLVLSAFLLVTPLQACTESQADTTNALAPVRHSQPLPDPVLNANRTSDHSGGVGKDFAALCSDPSVLFCQGFDHLPPNVVSKDGEGVFANGPIELCNAAIWPQNCPTIDNGALKFTIPSNSGPSASGSYYANFADISGDSILPGERVFWRWKQRFSPELIETVYSDGGGWKQGIIGDPDDWSCSDNEVVIQNTNQRGYPRMYHSCGLYTPFDSRLGSYDFDLQPGGETSCKYSTRAGGPGCFTYVADEWMQFQVGIEYAIAGKDRVQLWAAREGDSGWTHLIDYSIDLVDVPGGFGKVWFTPYHTHKDSTQVHPVAYTWYDELIISKSFVPLTSATTSPTPKTEASLTPN